MNTRLYENGDIITKVEFVFSGYGINAQAVYHKFVTTFSISEGVIDYRKYYPCKCFYR